MVEYSADVGMGVSILNCRLREVDHGTLMVYSLMVHESVVIRRRLVKPKSSKRLQCRDLVTDRREKNGVVRYTTNNTISPDLLKLEMRAAASAYAALMKANRQAAKQEQEQS